MQRLRLATWIPISPYEIFGIESLEQLSIDWTACSLSNDFLTGIPNRQAYEQAVDLAIKESTRQNAGFGLLVLDIDKFKHINDSYGHLAGDAVLKEFSSRVKKTLRDNDFLARYGGEEFVILTPCYNKVFEIGERVRLAVSSAPFHLEGGLMLNITCSFGCSVYPINGFNNQEIFQKADEALYNAKTNGRNQGCTAESKAPDVSALLE